MLKTHINQLINHLIAKNIIIPTNEKTGLYYNRKTGKLTDFYTNEEDIQHYEFLTEGECIYDFKLDVVLPNNYDFDNIIFELIKLRTKILDRNEEFFILEVKGEKFSLYTDTINDESGNLKSKYRYICEFNFNNLLRYEYYEEYPKPIHFIFKLNLETGSYI